MILGTWAYRGKKVFFWLFVSFFLNNPLNLYHLDNMWAPTPEGGLDRLPVPPSSHALLGFYSDW